MVRKIVLSFLAVLCLGTLATMAQRVTGVVISEEDNQPVVGASVLVKGTQIGAVTDLDGSFVLTNLPKEAQTLVVSYVGMITREVAIKPNLRIELAMDAAMLDDVMVVAFGTAKKSAFTGSAKVVEADELAKSQVTSVTNALAGVVPGLALTSSDGAPGSTSKISIRGVGSINAETDPLVILDGAPYDIKLLSNLNPADVESMTVLKDAASNALYGARGANGVIIITTKRAKSGDAVVTFDAKWGVNTNALRQYNIVKDPALYYEMHYAALRDYYISEGASPAAAWSRANANLFGDQGNGGLGYNVYTIPAGQMLIGQNGKLNPNATLGRTETYRGEEYYLTPDDWNAVGTRTGFRQEYNLSISAAQERSSYYMSVGYLDTEGITYASQMKRLNARLRADYQVKSWMKVGGNFSYTRFNSDLLDNNGTSTSNGNVWAFTTQMAPIYPAYIRTGDGKVKIDENGIGMMDYGNGGNAGMARPFLSDANPIQDNQLNTYNSEGNASTGNAFVNFNFVKGLTITLNNSYSLDETRTTLVYNPYYGQFDSTGGTVVKEHDRTFDYNLQQLINYSTTIDGVHNLDVMVGHEYWDYRTYALWASKNKMFSQSNKELGGAIIDGQSSNSYLRRTNTEGFFGRVQYDYAGRIFASASLRRDASSKFHPDYRWGTFWSVGAAWLLNKERWFNAGWVQELKLKASYGVQGNDNIGRYRYTDVFEITNSAGSVGTSFYTKGSKDISWETTGNFNIGAEFQLWRRLTGSLEYYYRKTSDMLFSFTVAPSLGYSSYYDNVGDMYNTGLELDLTVNIFNKKNLYWDVNLNFATLRNRVTKLHEDKKTYTYSTLGGKEYNGYTSNSYFIAEGLPIYSWRLKEYAGVDPETGRSLWYRDVEEKDGSITRDTTDDWTLATYYATGETTLPKCYGGFGTTLKAYGLDFSISFNYALGGKQYDYTYARFMSSPTGTSTGYNFHADLLKSWTPEAASASIPRFFFTDTYSAGQSTRFLTSASFLNLQNINLGYTFPAKWTQKAQISALRIYLSCENVAYWSKRRGFDPRQSYNNNDSNYNENNATHYAPIRTVSGGISLKF